MLMFSTSKVTAGRLKNINHVGTQGTHKKEAEKRKNRKAGKRKNQAAIFPGTAVKKRKNDKKDGNNEKSKALYTNSS